MKSLFKSLFSSRYLLATKPQSSLKVLIKSPVAKIGTLTGLAAAAMFLFPSSAKAVTTTLNFNQTPTLVSGTALSAGSVYRFANVTTGVDALVQITTISNAQLKILDDNATSPNRFQPTIAPSSASLTNSQSFIRFDFKLTPSSTPAGTTFAAAPTTTATNVYFSAQDVDGNGSANTIREFVETIGAVTSYVANPTLLQSMPSLPIAGGVGYEQSNSANVQAGIGTEDRYEFYSFLGSSVNTFTIVGGNITGTTGCTLNSTGCDRQNSWTFDAADVQRLDFGDAPLSYGNAYHPVPPTPTVYLGASVDGDDGPIYTPNADGDDTTGTDDENGVASFPTLSTASTTYSLSVACAGSGTVAGWIDFNRNGFFEASERAAGTCNGTSVPLNWTGLSGLTVGATYARFRTASIASEVANPTGQASNGEVEDYPLAIAAPIADLSLTKVVNNASPNVGENVTFTVTLSNAGPNSATGVSVADLLPAGLTFVSATTSQGTYSNTTGVWSVGSIASATNATLQITATVATAGAKTNTAQVTASGQQDPDSTPNNNVATEDDQASVTVTPPVADLSLTKTTSNTTPNVGENITFTVTLSNAGPNSATGVNVTDLLPAGLTFVSATPSPGTTYNNSTGVWTVGTVASATGTTLQIVATVATAGAKTNTAQVSASGQQDPDSTPNNSIATEDDQASVTVTPPSTDLSIVKTDSPDPVIAGANLTYAIAVTNNGPVAATNVVMSDPLPSGTTFQSITAPSGWNCTTPAVGSNGTVSCTNTSLAVGTANFTLVARVNPNTANNASLSNTATVSSTTSDSNTSNNSSLQTTTVRQSADLRLTKISTPASPTVGSNFDYTITVTNDGPSTATNVQVRDALPLGIGYVLNTPSQGTYDPIGTQVWNVGTLNPGASATLVIRAIRNSAANTVNTAEVIAADQSDPDSPHNNQVAGEDDQDSVTVPNQPVDLAVAKTVNNSTPSVGQNVTFTITVANPAGSTVTATNIGINDVLPQGLTYQSHTVSTGTYNSGTGVWSVPSLAPGTTATLTLVAQVTTSGAKINTAQLSTLDQSDPNANNDSSSATVTPATVGPNLLLVKRITAVAGTPTSGFNDLTTGSKAADDNNTNWPTPLATYLRGLLNGGSVAPGAEVEYTIYFLNNQNAATNVTICDPIPANLTFVTNGYNSASPRPTEPGALPTDTGIALASNAATLPINPTFYLTNANDSDRGRYYPPNDPSTPNACKRVDAAGNVTATGAAANTDGAIVVNVVSGANQLPPATTSGNPTNSYGYIRFKARVR